MRAKDNSGAGEAESLLARWSRRKRQAVRSPEEGDETKVAAVSEAPRESAPVPRDDDTPPPGDADMPALESLGPESDYSGFMSPGVSEELRRLALRKLFHGPLYNITDGLDDYDDDFTSFAVLREAFHAKRGKTAASESAPPEGVDHETAGEAGREQPARSASAEIEQEAEADSTGHPRGESAEGGEKQVRPGPESRTSVAHSEVSGGTGLTGEGGSPHRGPDPEDADPPTGSVESATRHMSSAGHPDGREEAEMIPDSSAGRWVDEKAAAQRPDEGERTEDRDTAGPEPDERNRHG